jgi:hypothetical protein
MTVNQAIKLLRDSIGKRGEHHSNCSFALGKRLQCQARKSCDCYAKGREELHEALDLLSMVATTGAK